MKKGIIFSIILFFPLALVADSEALPTQKVTASYFGSCFFKMIPQKHDYQGLKAYGVAYCLAEDGSFKEMWKVSGWYSWRVYISDDGHYLVRMGPWASGDSVKKGDLAVAFYMDGKLLKEYSTMDLVKDLKKIMRTASHYFWLASDATIQNSGNKFDPLMFNADFWLTTIDGIKYHFDATTGTIVEEKKIDLKPFPE